MYGARLLCGSFPVNAIKIKKDKAVVSDECVECGACINQCPNEAITLSR
jgi:NAD-dependent dihydropyrimidine dehydrogenase PreA subunit